MQQSFSARIPAALLLAFLLAMLPAIDALAHSHWPTVDGTCGFRGVKMSKKKGGGIGMEEEEWQLKDRFKVEARATLTAMDGNTWTIENEGTACTVAVSDVPGDRTAVFSANGPGRLPLRFFTIGNTLLVRGQWTTATNTIDANRIYNLSVRFTAVYGTVESVTDTGWRVALVGLPAVEGRRPEIPSATIDLVPSPGTRYYSWGPYGTAGMDPARIEPGHIITIRGIWDPGTTNFTHVDRIKDLSVGIPAGAVFCNFGSCSTGSYPVPGGAQ